MLGEDVDPVTAAFGPELVTYYSGSSLNRLGFLRENYEFLNAALNDPSTAFVLIAKHDPLLQEETASDSKYTHTIAELGIGAVRDLIGSPFAKPEQAQIDEWVPERDASGINHCQVVFLGINESQKGFRYKEYEGRPYFAVDVGVDTKASPELARKIEVLTENVPENCQFQSERFGAKLPFENYNVLAEAKHVLDWNRRVRFCAGCGRRNMSVHGGFKLVCPPCPEVPCPSRGVLTNISFPRTDCTIIVAVLSYDGSKVLLGRNRRFPAKLYSCLAGFLEPGESIEDCVRREVYEEAGVIAGRVAMYASQPWPYPASIMLGCVASVKDSSDEAHKIHLGHDPELEDAKWFPLEEARDMLAYKPGGGSTPEAFIPPRFAIAWHLINAAANNLLIR